MATRSKSPSQRSLEALRRDGYTAQMVERWCPHARRRMDLYGFIDILAIRQGEVLGVQATSGAHHADRLSKALALPALRAWLLSGARFEVWSWRLGGASGARKLWTVRRQAVTLADLSPEEKSMEA